MSSFILQKTTVQCWRLFQILLVAVIFGLEFIQIRIFKPWYFEEPSHGSASYYWIVIFITFLTLLYFSSSFSYRWVTGPYKNEIYVDLFLTHLWIITSLMNIVTPLSGGKLACNYPEDEFKHARTTRCHLFLSSISLSWVVAATYIVSSYISIMRWRKRPIESTPPKFIDPPIVVHRPAETYLVQKGVLADGQPALFFHMAHKNTSNSNLSKGSTSGNVSPTSSSLHNQTQQSARTSIYLHGKDH